MTRKFVPALLVGGVLAMTLGAASAQEQVVNLYSARHYSTDEALYNDFTKATGIRINRVDADDAGILARLKAEGRPDAERQAAMRAVNPKFVLRNWIAESAIRAAQAGDFSETATVLACLSKPFDEQPEFERFAAPPPDWASGLSVSCSS